MNTLTEEETKAFVEAIRNYNYAAEANNEIAQEYFKRLNALCLEMKKLCDLLCAQITQQEQEKSNL